MVDKCVDQQPRAADRGQAEHRVGLGPDRVVDLGHDVPHSEGLGRELRREGVAVVALGQGEEPVGVLCTRAPQHVLVRAVGADGLTREVGLEPVEGISRDVDDRHVIAGPGQPLGKSGADSAAAHNHYSHGVIRLLSVIARHSPA